MENSGNARQGLVVDGSEVMLSSLDFVWSTVMADKRIWKQMGKNMAFD